MNQATGGGFVVDYSMAMQKGITEFSSYALLRERRLRRRVLFQFSCINLHDRIEKLECATFWSLKSVSTDD